MQIEFTDRDYRLTHGRAPRGRGSWAFHILDQGHDDLFWAPVGSLVEAKAWMRAEVRKLAGDYAGTVDVKVCT